MRGALPKLEFNGFAQLDEDGLAAVLTHIQRYPGWQRTPFKKRNAMEAVIRVLNGTTPTRSEIALLREVLGDTATANIAGGSEFWAKARHLGIDLINLPRTVMSSFDFRITASNPMTRPCTTSGTPRKPSAVPNNPFKRLMSDSSNDARKRVTTSSDTPNDACTRSNPSSSANMRMAFSASSKSAACSAA